MKIVRVAPIHDRIDQDRPVGFFNPQVSKNAPEGLFIYAVNIDLASLVHPTDSESPVANCLFTPTTIENISGLLSSKSFTARRLLQKFIDSTFKTGQSEIISLGFVAVTMSSLRLLPHGGAEIKSHHKRKDKYPQYDQQSYTPLVKQH